jgi:hypothetical protein
VWIPDTIVFNESDMNTASFWIYTNESGEVWRTDCFQPKNIATKLGRFTSSNELVAVIKRPIEQNGAQCGNDCKLLTTKELGFAANGLSTERSKAHIQRYIKCIGSKHFIVRTCWRKDDANHAFVITNKSSYYEYGKTDEYRKYLTNPKAYGSCTITETKIGKA